MRKSKRFLIRGTKTNPSIVKTYNDNTSNVPSNLPPRIECGLCGWDIHTSEQYRDVLFDIFPNISGGHWYLHQMCWEECRK